MFPLFFLLGPISGPILGATFSNFGPAARNPFFTRSAGKLVKRSGAEVQNHQSPIAVFKTEATVPVRKRHVCYFCRKTLRRVSRDALFFWNVLWLIAKQCTSLDQYKTTGFRAKLSCTFGTEGSFGKKKDTKVGKKWSDFPMDFRPFFQDFLCTYNRVKTRCIVKTSGFTRGARKN